MSRIPHEEMLEIYRRAHEAGDPDSARHALLLVAGVPGLVMPRWLAQMVIAAIVKSDRGEADELFWFGNEAALVARRKRFREGRDYSIRHSIEHAVAWHEARGTGVTKKQIIEAAAQKHRLSVKAIEKILYPPSPTGRGKK
ncbi:MAG: hypothetical protein IT515_08045 [Burkholderiales bacterium]|nr:hypothetical protein [Burkholderiales bacterium]